MPQKRTTQGHPHRGSGLVKKMALGALGVVGMPLLGGLMTGLESLVTASEMVREEQELQHSAQQLASFLRYTNLYKQRLRYTEHNLAGHFVPSDASSIRSEQGQRLLRKFPQFEGVQHPMPLAYRDARPEMPFHHFEEQLRHASMINTNVSLRRSEGDTSTLLEHELVQRMDRLMTQRYSYSEPMLLQRGVRLVQRIDVTDLNPEHLAVGSWQWMERTLNLNHPYTMWTNEIRHAANLSYHSPSSQEAVGNVERLSRLLGSSLARYDYDPGEMQQLSRSYVHTHVKLYENMLQRDTELIKHMPLLFRSEANLKKDIWKYGAKDYLYKHYWRYDTERRQRLLQHVGREYFDQFEDVFTQDLTLFNDLVRRDIQRARGSLS